MSKHDGGYEYPHTYEEFDHSADAMITFRDPGITCRAEFVGRWMARNCMTSQQFAHRFVDSSLRGVEGSDDNETYVEYLDRTLANAHEIYDAMMAHEAAENAEEEGNRRC